MELLGRFYFVLFAGLNGPLVIFVIFFVMFPVIVAFVIFLAPLLELLICPATELTYSALATAAAISTAAVNTKAIDKLTIFYL